jgi:excisionase family DNA binding protein
VSLQSEVEAIARRVVREELERQRDRGGGYGPWLTTEQAGELLGCTAVAIRHRLREGWLTGHTIKQGRRRLINRDALFASLERGMTAR